MAVPSTARFAGKVAICTGSTAGIGLSVARRLASEGAHVVVSSRKQSNVDASVDELRNEGYSVIGVPCHSNNVQQQNNLVRQTLDTFGGIDILFHNVGINLSHKGIMNVEENVWDKMFDVNVKSAYQMTRQVTPHMKKRGSGSIVFISSVAAYCNMPVLGLYGPCKAALGALAKAMGQELVRDNIRINVVAAGLVETKFANFVLDNDHVREVFEKANIASRMATTEEISGTVAFLCSQEASYITTETVVVGGGYHARL